MNRNIGYFELTRSSRVLWLCLDLYINLYNDPHSMVSVGILVALPL